MNTSLYFLNLTEAEIRKILNVVTVSYLVEPMKKSPDKYFSSKKQMQSLSREAVTQIYLKFLSQKDPVLSLYLSDIVVDIIHYFKLSDAFKNLLTTDDPDFCNTLASKIEQRKCPITVDMFMRLLDRPVEVKKKEIFDVEAILKDKEAKNGLEPEPLEDEEETIPALETEVKEEIEEEKVEDIKTENDDQQDKLEETIKDLEYQLINLQMENESLKEENRNLLFQMEDENEIDDLRHSVNVLTNDRAHLNEDVLLLTQQNTALQNQIRANENYKSKYNQALLELRDYKIKYISLDAEMDQLKYTIKNDNKKLKELEQKNRNVQRDESDWMLAMHDLTWYRKQWNLPGNAPLHKIWAHLNREEAKGLAYLLKNYDHLLKADRQKAIDTLKEILIVKEAILVLLKKDKKKITE